LAAGKGGSGTLGEAKGGGLAKRLWWQLLQAALVPAQAEMALSLWKYRRTSMLVSKRFLPEPHAFLRLTPSFAKGQQLRENIWHIRGPLRPHPQALL